MAHQSNTVEPKLDLSSRQLQAVLTLAEQRSFIAAAAALRVSQPALTRTIKQVERTVGVPLFLRTTRQVRITPAGREFVAIAERLLGDLRIGVESLRKRGGQRTASIVVATVLPLAGALSTKSLSDYESEYPGVHINLREGIHADVLDDVGSGVADFGIGYVDGLPGNFLGATLAIERLHVLLPSAHELASHAHLDITKLAGARLVSFPPDSRTRRLVDGAAAANGFALHYVATTNRLATLLELVRTGFGIAVVPSSEFALTRARGTISRPLLGPQLASRLGTFHLRHRDLSPPAMALLAVVRRWVRERTRG